MKQQCKSGGRDLTADNSYFSGRFALYIDESYFISFHWFIQSVHNEPSQRKKRENDRKRQNKRQTTLTNIHTHQSIRCLILHDMYTDVLVTVADNRVIKAELHLPDRARQRATVRPSRLLLMTWASKNWPLLSRPSLRCAGNVKYQIPYNFSICSVLHRLTVPYIAARGHIRRRTSPYIHKHTCRMRQLTVPYAVWTRLKDHQRWRHIYSNECLWDGHRHSTPFA